MTRAAWLNALLAAAIVGIGALVYLRPRDGAQSDYILASFKPDEARAIRIERPDGSPIVLERRGEDWYLRQPFAARADPARVQRLLSIAGARATARMPAQELARFDLDRPLARVTIDDQPFDFGMVNPVSGEQYVLTSGSVYTVAGAYGGALPGSAGDLAERQLLTRNEVPESIELASFRVFRQEGKWVMTPPGKDLSQDDLQRWADDWRHASALRVESAPRPRAPAGVVRMRFRDGSALSLGILTREPELALLRPDEKLVFYFFKGAAQRLLSPPQAPREERAARK